MLKIGSSSTKQAGLDKHVRVEHGVELSMVYGDAVTQQLHWSARGEGGRGGLSCIRVYGAGEDHGGGEKEANKKMETINAFLQHDETHFPDGEMGFLSFHDNSLGMS